MKFTRSEFAEGFQLLGAVGFLAGFATAPEQWGSGAVRPETTVGILVSAACVVAAMLLSQSIKPAVVVVLQVLLVGGLLYVALVPFIAAKVGWQQWQGVGVLALVSSLAASIGWYGLRHIRRRDA